MRDKDIILKILKDNQWHNVLEIMHRGKPGAIGWAVRSRISDLKRDGHMIESVLDKNGMAKYMLRRQNENTANS